MSQKRQQGPWGPKKSPLKVWPYVAGAGAMLLGLTGVAGVSMVVNDINQNKQATASAPLVIAALPPAKRAVAPKPAAVAAPSTTDIVVTAPKDKGPKIPKSIEARLKAGATLADMGTSEIFACEGADTRKLPKGLLQHATNSGECGSKTKFLKGMQLAAK